MKRIITYFIVSLILLININITHSYRITEINTLGTLTEQLDNLYKEVGEHLGIDYNYVRIIHLLAGGRAIFANRIPNIYNELTVQSLEGPFDITGTNVYMHKAQWATSSSHIIRPNRHYLPDAAFSVTAEIVNIMNNRYKADRGIMQPFFNALRSDVKKKILFCEAMMYYTGSSMKAVDALHIVYEDIIHNKDINENIIERTINGEYRIREKFKGTFIESGIDGERELEILAFILSFDGNLAKYNNADDIKEYFVSPFTVGETSRENLMSAALSLVGKVRYVWGGGHLGTGQIAGINPVWREFFDAYSTESGGRGFNMSIKPNRSWCPIHGYHTSENACLYSSNTIRYVEEFIRERRGRINVDRIENENFKRLILNAVDIERGVLSHRFDGLDCSGFTSWLFNQVNTDRRYDSTATPFIRAGNFTVLPYESKMLPGDVFSWGAHIVVVVGGVSSGPNAYVMVEASPNMVKFGVIHYGNASAEEIEEARQVAVEANTLLGNINDTERVNVNNIDNITEYSGYYVENIRGVRAMFRQPQKYVEIGRLHKPFIDEMTIIEGFNKRIIDMTAREVIQHTINRYPRQFLSGLRIYTGELFEVQKINNSVNNIIRSNTVERLVDL